MDIRAELAKFKRIDEEWKSTIFCPCGDSFSWESIDERLDPWVKKHKPHVSKTAPR